jgi:hypothetical protein
VDCKKQFETQRPLRRINTFSVDVNKQVTPGLFYSQIEKGD